MLWNLFRWGIRPIWFFLTVVMLVMMSITMTRAAEYRSNRSLGRRLMSLAEQNPDVMRVTDLARSLGKRKVWLVEIGKGAEQDRLTRPAMLLVAGIEGNDLIGSSVAAAWIERLIEQYGNDDEVTKLLETTTLYIVPRLNPDAAEHFFAESKREVSVNNKPVDDDHDGLVDEDGPEDLNGDGLISWMRIEDPEGGYILDPKDNRLLMKADHLKGEVGAWRYLLEGIDNDHDERWNEDGPGGVNFNRNFPHDYKFFAPDAGIHQVSEAETRALADFIVEHPNIGVIVTYGVADNLLKTPKSARPPGSHNPLTAIDEDDVGYFKVMGELYRKTLGIDKELEGVSEPGTFSDWMYYHRGRLSLAAKAWSPEMAVAMLEATEKEDKKTEEKVDEGEEKPSEPGREKGKKRVGKDKEEDKRNEQERKELKWFDEHWPEAFIEWQPVKHPDFSKQQVEIGGYRPFVLTNPPVAMVEQVVAKQTDFLTRAAQRLPRIGVRKIEARHLGRSVYEVEVQIENTGFLPTVLSHGQRTREVHPTRLVLKLDDECFLSGSRITTLPTIRGSGGMIEQRFVVRAPGRDRIDFEVVSMLAGHLEGTVKLSEAE
ncbi:MAG: hypothetical protein JXM79_23420 [Sedimentisphaerales bacterium]|nr:hypothetical protein [Sedimentisphaerales bacterium]